MAADKKKSNGTYVFGKTSLDVEALRQIVEVVEASEVTRLVWQNGDEKLILRRGNPVDAGDFVLPDYDSGLSPALRATSVQRVTSLCTNAANSAGGLPTASAPSRWKRSRMFGSAITRTYSR